MTKHIFWLASYPKSGNTLLRAILASLFFTEDGKFSFDLFKNIGQFEAIERLNFINNINKKDFLKLDNIKILSKYWHQMQEKEKLGFNGDFGFLKSHHALFSINKKFFTSANHTRGYIYLVRDPRDVVISWANHTNVSLDDAINFLTDYSSCIAWVYSNKALLPKNILPKNYVSSWDQHVISWTKNNIEVPKITIRYEDLVYDKKNTILKIVKFFNNSFRIKLSNIDKKIENITNTTDFNKFKNIEKKEGFKESVNGPFFRQGKKNQWQNLLNLNQIKIIENKFKKTMIEYGYKLNAV